MAKKAAQDDPRVFTKVCALIVVSVLTVAGLVWASGERPAPPPSSSVVYVAVGIGHGSGVHIGNGLILTAAHVTDGAKPQVRDDSGYLQDAEVLWENEKYDIALIRVKTYGQLRAAELSCHAARPGDRVIAYGSPFDWEFIRFNGVIAGFPRQIGPWASAFPLDITVAPGMSGGPLVDSKGHVVGIVVGGRGSSPFPGPLVMSAAVPSTVACELMGRA